MSSNDASEFVDGNYFDKYRSTNPIHQLLMKRFLNNALDLLNMAQPNSIAEAGCGPGDLAATLLGRIKWNPSYVGSDLSIEQIDIAKSRLPDRKFLTASICDLPFRDAEFDLVIACEVLEHIEDPGRAIEELARVTKKWAIVSVPWEPTWRVLNVLRGKYIREFGNTPGHVQNFSRRAIRRLVRSRFEIVVERHPLPWTMFLLRTAK